MTYFRHRKSRWMGGLVLLSGLTLLLFPVAAQVKRILIRPGQPPVVVRSGEVSPEGGPAFVTNRDMSRRFNYAQKMLEKGDYRSGIAQLQSLLNESEDWFFLPQDSDQRNRAAKPANRSHYLSLKSEAERLVGELPVEGQRFYENEYGHTARLTLKEAVARGNVKALNDIARRYFHTEAGYEAVYRLGISHLDHGEYFAAALQFQRLKALPQIAKRFDPLLSVKLALCWDRAGLSEQSEAVLRDLKRQFPGTRLRLGNQEVTLFEPGKDARHQLAKVWGQEDQAGRSRAEQWWMFRGNHARNAGSLPATPVGSVAWSRSTLGTTGDAFGHSPAQIAALERELTNLAGQRQSGKHLQTLPAAMPLIVEDLAIYRTLANLHAVDLRTGETRWETAQVDPLWPAMLDRSAQSSPEEALPPGVQPLDAQPPSAQQLFLTQRSWRDLTFGTISSDGRQVYSVELLGLAEGFNYTARGEMHPLAPRPDNRLMAFDLANGKAAWEAGGSPEAAGNKLAKLAGTFFFGAPLPLGQQLYCLGERNGEISLMVLQAGDGSLVWEQRLLTPNLNLSRYRPRRLAGLSPTYGQGVMICPTSAGAVVAVDVSRRLLLWAYQYESEDLIADPFIQARMAGFALPQGAEESHWADFVPLIADGRVLLTPQDSQELHCLNLADGKLQWTVPRGQNLHVAGIFEGTALLVGPSQVQAVRLTDGQDAWKAPLPIPVPSGRGFRAGHLYHLPLQTGEVATIDLKTGRLVARSKWPGEGSPGNLVSAGGRVVFQSIDSVGALTPLDQLNARLNQQLPAEPKEPNQTEALALRGTVKLHQGDEQGALADLRTAWNLQRAESARTLLVGILFNALQSGAPGSPAQREELRQLIRSPQERLRFLRLLTSQDLPDAGSRSETMAEYLELARSLQGKRALEAVDETHQVRSDRWIRARLTQLLSQASSEERAQWDDRCARELQTVIRDLPPLKRQRAFACFPASAPLEAIQLQLLRGNDDPTPGLDEVWILEQLRQSPHQTTRAQATAQLAALYVSLARPVEAGPLIDEVAERWADVKLLNQQTGQELAAQWREKLKPLPNQPPLVKWPDQKLRAQLRIHRGAVLPEFPIPINRPSDSRFSDWTFSIDQQAARLVARDENGQERWHFNLSEMEEPLTTFRDVSMFLHGHLAVLSLKSHFVVLDLLNRQRSADVLWSKRLTDGPLDADQFLQMQPFQRNRGFFPQPGNVSDNTLAWGKVGLVNAQVVAYQVGEKLIAADPLTGDPLWIREAIPADGELFGDERHLLVIDSKRTTAWIYRLEDGELLATRKLPPLERQVGNNGPLLLWLNSAKAERTLDCLDLVTGQTHWQRPCPEGTRIHQLSTGEVALLHPEGRFCILSVPDGGERVNAMIEPLKDLTEHSVHRLATCYVLLTHSGHPTVNPFASEAALGSVNGPVYAFDLAEGKQIWKTPLERQVLEQLPPKNSPVLVFNTRQLPAAFGGGRFGANDSAIRVLDLRTGAVIYQNDRLRNLSPFSIKVHPDRPAATLNFYEGSIEIELTKEPLETSRS